MADFKAINCSHPDGTLVIYTAQPLEGSDRPVVVMLHGALRNAGMLARWGDLLANDADIVLIDLPGHGRSSFIESGALPVLTTIIQRVVNHLFAGRRVLLVGESISGTIALSMAGQENIGPIRAVFAADPPLTTAKQWSIHLNFRHFSAAHPEAPYVPVLGRDFFGIQPDNAEERIYYALLGALKVPTVVASGDVPLLPPRSLHGAITNVIDDVDRFVMATTYSDKVRYQPVTNSGHLLLVDAEAQCLAIIRQLLAEHLAA